MDAGKMLQHLHVSMAELSMEVGLTADAVSSASLLRKAGFTSGWTGFVNTGRLLGTSLRTGPTAAASVCRRKSEQLLSKDQVEGSRFKCSLPHEQRTSNTGTNVRPYGVSEYRTRRGKPCS